MEKRIFILFILAVALLTLFAIIMLNQGQNNLETREVCFQGNCFIAELAKTAEQRTRGLMFRESMDANKGMLFVFENETEHSFWMKNTLMPLDIIWINENKEVVFIEKNARPCVAGPHTFSKGVGAGDECEKIKPNKSAKYVLELNAGSADKINLKISDDLSFTL